MPELFHVDDAAKIRVFGPPAVLDALVLPGGVLRGRVAPDELLLLGPPGQGPALAGALEAVLAEEGPSALVIDHTDGWSCFALVGRDLEEVFARVSHVPLPPPAAEPAFLMGRICDVPGKAFRRAGRVDLLTGAEAHEHVRHRLEQAGRSLGLRTVPAPLDAPLDLPEVLAR